MTNKPVPYPTHTLGNLFERISKQVNPTSGVFWMRLGFLALILYVILHKDISIDLEFYRATQDKMAANVSGGLSGEAKAIHASEKESKAFAVKKAKSQSDDNLANTFSNMLFDDNDVTKAEREEKRRKMLAYVKLYADLAKEEMRRSGIPASITLAQGLLESDAGESRLAVQNNNHFGLKCFSRTCRRGHCTNYTDDSHKDFFRKFRNPAESFKAHSNLLQGERYKFLYQYKKTDYVSWAKGLKQAGYATDPLYDQKLINLIKELDLHSYD